MNHDAAGLSISGSESAARALQAAQHSYLKYRSDLSARVGELIAADPDFGHAHTLKAMLMLTGFRASDGQAIQVALDEAARLDDKANPREHLHLLAARQWQAGDPLSATRTFDTILHEHPCDVLAFRLHHFLNFWLGRPEAMLACAERVAPAWDPAWPFQSALLACRAFAHEECGHYLAAENLGRRAVELDPGDPWGAHAVAHVLEMQGRHHEGIAWIESLQDHWADRNNLSHHLWWHQGLYHFELGDFDRVLALYDERFRNLDAPLTRAAPDLYIDVQNAVAMLFRLQLQAVAVGKRWQELADHAQNRIGDCTTLFTLPHWLIALAATQRWSRCDAMIAGLQDYANSPTASADGRFTASVLLPACQAIMHHARGEYGAACDAMRPTIGGLFRLGGSHAQQELFMLLYLDSGLRAGREADIRLVLERAGGRYRLPLARRRLYAKAAHARGF